MNTQATIQKTHLVPQPEWQSNDNLEVRGDVLEVLEQQMFVASDALAKAGQAMGAIMRQNIKTEKIKLNYVWNNGEEATEAEVAEFKARMEEVRKQQEAEMAQQQEAIQMQANAAKTGLVDPSGQPVGTTQDLSMAEAA